MTSRPPPVGFYGKLPLLGDFVSRRLPRDFITPWDHWLQSGLSVSREQLGAEWLDAYLTSPIWRFALSPGICGGSAWAGVLMPSVDKVGRYFPLTLAAAVDKEILPYLFDARCSWFEKLERLALSGLEDGFVLNDFDQALQAVPFPEFLAVDKVGGSGSASESTRGKQAFHIAMDDITQLPAAFMGLSACLLERFLPLHSYWGSTGSERLGASLLVCENLPPLDAFCALMTGRWAQRGWGLQSRSARVTVVAVQADTAPSETPVSVDVVQRPIDGPRWCSYGLSVVGKRRKINEDALLERPEIGLWVVADGMGGHRAGDVASQSIVDTLDTVSPTESIETYTQAVEASLQNVNFDLCRLARLQGDDQIIGSTVVVFLALGARCAYLWAGDSRLYRYRAAKLEQLTRDHAWHEEGVPQVSNSAITRAVGADTALNVEIGHCMAEPGDMFLLCTDGLDKELTHAEIEVCFAVDDPKSIAQSLVERAEARGARDNVTVLVVQYLR